MQHSDSIIVYRNPLEKMFWEGASGINILSVLVFFIVMLLVFAGVYSIIKWIGRYNVCSVPNWATWVSLVISGGCGGLAVYLTL